MGKMALGEVVKGRNEKGTRWHWTNRQRMNWHKGEMGNGRKDDWAWWQWGKMVKGKMGRGRDGKGRNGKKSWAKWEWANWEDIRVTSAADDRYIVLQHLCNSHLTASATGR